MANSPPPLWTHANVSESLPGNQVAVGSACVLALGMGEREEWLRDLSGLIGIDHSDPLVNSGVRPKIGGNVV